MPVVLYAALALAAHASQIRYEPKLTPKLDPQSHKEFFDKDYIADGRPQNKTHFQHPYPVLQDSEDYDKDYTKDENTDSGEWAAQDKYDKLRTSGKADKWELKAAERR